MLLVILVAIFIAITIVVLSNLTYVSGASMLPSLKEGDIMFTPLIIHSLQHPVEGDIYTYKHDGKRVVKRLSKYVVEEDGSIKCYFLGDNSALSYDSRYYGWVDWEKVLRHCVKVWYS